MSLLARLKLLVDYPELRKGLPLFTNEEVYQMRTEYMRNMAYLEGEVARYRNELIRRGGLHPRRVWKDPKTDSTGTEFE